MCLLGHFYTARQEQQLGPASCLQPGPGTAWTARPPGCQRGGGGEPLQAGHRAQCPSQRALATVLQGAGAIAHSVSTTKHDQCSRLAPFALWRAYHS